MSTLTGTQVLLLVVSETGLVYTFTTQKLSPLVTDTDGKNLIAVSLFEDRSFAWALTQRASHASEPIVPKQTKQGKKRRRKNHRCSRR